MKKYELLLVLALFLMVGIISFAPVLKRHLYGGYPYKIGEMVKVKLDGRVGIVRSIRFAPQEVLVRVVLNGGNAAYQDIWCHLGEVEKEVPEVEKVTK